VADTGERCAAFAETSLPVEDPRRRPSNGEPRPSVIVMVRLRQGGPYYLGTFIRLGKRGRGLRNRRTQSSLAP
jgi:hypothetical protein